MTVRTIMAIASPSARNDTSGMQLAVIEGQGAIAMQPALPVALPPSGTASPVISKLQLGPADFGGALAKLLAIVAPTVTTKPASAPSTIPVTTPAPAPATTLVPVPAPTQAPPVATALTQLPLPTEDPSLATKATVATPHSGTTVTRQRSAPTTRREPVIGATATPAIAAPIIATTAPSVPVTAAPAVEISLPAASANAPSSHDTVQPQADVLAAPPPAAVPAQPLPPEQMDPKPAVSDAETAADHKQVAVTAIATQPTLPATPNVATPTLPATAAPTQAATATTPTLPHTTATPAEQITPALVSLGHAPDGAQRLTMRLQPPELGQVQIRIDRPTLDAPARVAITVERPETLTLLLRDQPQLQRALDQAGVPAEGRSLTFHVATPEPATRTDTAMAPQPMGSASSMGGDLSHGTSRQGDRPMQADTAAIEDFEEIGAIPSAPVSWLRAGLDITA